MTQSVPKPEGWAMHGAKALKYHYYRDGKSLCGRHRFNGPYHVWETSPMTLDCKTCWKVKATGRG